LEDNKEKLTLRDALKDEKLTLGEIPKLELSTGEVAAIIASTGNEVRLATGKNLSPEAQKEARAKYWGLSEKMAYKLYAGDLNTRNAKRVLMLRNKALQESTGNLYKVLRGMNPVHYALEKGYSIGAGEEPVTGERVDRVQASTELLLYFAVLKGGQVLGKQLARLKPRTGGTPSGGGTIGNNKDLKANARRFFKKAPKGSNNFKIEDLPDGSYRISYDTPARSASMSHAHYEKVVDSSGITTSVTKASYDSAGSLVHLKNK